MLFRVIILILFYLLSANTARAGEADWILKPGMAWWPTETGIMADHGSGRKCLHSVSAAVIDMSCFDSGRGCEAYIDHGNYLALRSGMWIYWVSKEASLCYERGSGIPVPAVEKTWICEETCAPP